jgi:hypothetical protein
VLSAARYAEALRASRIRVRWDLHDERADNALPSASEEEDPSQKHANARAAHGKNVVGVAQLVEHLVVVQEVAGSSPVTHPMKAAS